MWLALYINLAVGLL